MAKITFIDLFCGLGGLRLGLEQALNILNIGHECVFSSEIKPYAIQVYKDNFNDDEVYGDITQINVVDIPDFDILLAGFPCQPFSSAGNRKGFKDTRGTLFFEIERILKGKIESGYAAKGFILENVEGLINHDNGDTLRTILEHLVDLGYTVNYKLLDSQYFGMAQSRKRVYIVGTLKNNIDLDNFNITTSKLGDVLEYGSPTINNDFTRKLFEFYKPDDLIGKAIKDKRGGDNNIHSWDFNLKGNISKNERILMNKLLTERRKKKWADIIGITWMDGMPLTEEMIQTFYSKSNLHNMLLHLTELNYLVYEHPKQQITDENGVVKRIYDTSKEKGYNIVTGKLSFEFSKILDPDKLAPTLVAMDVSKLGVIDNGGLRRLTINECKKLCGYPDDYRIMNIKDSEAFDLLGNTVCVPVIKEIALRLIPNID